jgi:hypothetical protein
MNFEDARKIADAVLYEGYVLYPYRSSSQKNKFRWQFGVLAPRAWSEAGGREPWWNQTECIVETAGELNPVGKFRFLQLQHRRLEKFTGDDYRPVESIELEGCLWQTWDEAVEREIDICATLGPGESCLIPFGFEGAETNESIVAPSGRLVGRFVRVQQPVAGLLELNAECAGDSTRLTKLHLRVENLTPWDEPGAAREAVIRSSLAGAHCLLGLTGACFISMLDPPEFARAAVDSCLNLRTWPVLVGADGASDVVLSSPIILYDYPQIAPESPGNLFDATEIDEILTLRTMTLTDDEKREARASDPRAAAIIDRVDSMPPEMLDRLHGSIRYLRKVTTRHEDDAAPAPWWDPAADASVSPETDCIRIGDSEIAKGARVLLRPGRRRADAQDMFLQGKTARVEGVFFDVDNNEYLAVTLEDDPGAELHQSHVRFLYFYPDEVEPLAPAAEVNQ